MGELRRYTPYAEAFVDRGGAITLTAESWQPARLIPTSGINGAAEAERRATSALLAVMAAVKEFGRALLQPLGAPAGAVETFIEVPFAHADKTVIPDGLIQVTRGQRRWVCLVEVKTSDNLLEVAQLENYLDVARENGLDALLTVSNEFASAPGVHPTAVDRRKLRRVSLHHLSWTQVLSEAVLQKVHRGISDPEQAYILGELIRYLEHPRSGALEFDDMGSSWTSVREAVSRRTLRISDRGATEVANRWEQLGRYACLRLGRQLGTEVQPIYSRRELNDPALRAQTVLDRLVSDGILQTALRIPHAASPVTVTADLRASEVYASIEVESPREGRNTTRINWLTRQLKNAPDELRVEAFAQYSRGPGAAELLKTVRETPQVLVVDPQRELRSFRLTLSAPLGGKRGRGRGSFIDSVLHTVDRFYGEVVQGVKPWSAPPPKLRPAAEDSPPQPGVPQALVSTAYSSQDGPEQPDDTAGSVPTDTGTVSEQSSVVSAFVDEGERTIEPD